MFRPSDCLLRFVFKPIVFLAALVPFFWLLWALLTGRLSANPLSDITNETGIWTLRFLCLTLAVTPIRRLTGWNRLIRFRRMLGLFAFFYGTTHFVIYIVLDRAASVGLLIAPIGSGLVRDVAKAIGEDISKRPFITIGFTAWVCMVPLALTSTTGMIRRLGGRRWQQLHRLVYVSIVAGVVHYWWGVKADVTRPQIYAVVAALLLGFRIIRKAQESKLLSRAAL